MHVKIHINDIYSYIRMYTRNLHAHLHLCNGQVACARDTHTYTSIIAWTKPRTRNTECFFKKNL